MENKNKKKKITEKVITRKKEKNIFFCQKS